MPKDIIVVIISLANLNASWHL